MFLMLGEFDHAECGGLELQEVACLVHRGVVT